MSKVSEVSVVDFPETLLYGLSVKTRMENSKVDCPALWQEFMPKFAALGLPEKTVQTYGLSMMDDPADMNAFIYWAAFPAQAGQKLPQGFAEVVLPAGTYAKCRISGLADLADGFGALFAWSQQSPDFEASMTLPGFELYGAEYMGDGGLELYMGLEKK